MMLLTIFTKRLLLRKSIVELKFLETQDSTRPHFPFIVEFIPNQAIGFNFGNFCRPTLLHPPTKFWTFLQAKEKERRLKMREEKKEQQRLHQEERVRKALERAKAAPKKQVTESW